MGIKGSGYGRLRCRAWGFRTVSGLGFRASMIFESEKSAQRDVKLQRGSLWFGQPSLEA